MSRHEVEFEYKDKGTGKTYQVKGDGDVFVDSNYGADADGNRGCSRTFVEDDGFTIYDEEADVTETIRVENPKLYAAIEEEVGDKLVEADEDDGDCDREYDSWKDEQMMEAE